MADDVEIGNPSKKARLEGAFDDSVGQDQAKLGNDHYSTCALSETDLSNQRNVGEGGQTDDEHPETSKSSADPAPDSDNDSSVSGLSNLSGLSGEESWKPVSGPMSWVYRQMSAGMDPRNILRQIIPHETHIPDLDDLTLWKLVINIVCEPPPRTKLDNVNTLSDVVQLMKTCKNIVVLTGAGVSVSCGIPDFRSRNGVYARLAVDYPDLPDPQAMFDIHYFRSDQRPFFKFAKEIFPGQFEPSKCHKFIRLIEDHGKLLRNYTQNIDTLEQVAGITKIIQCHGSFASATCMVCGHKCTADDIKTNIMDQVVPVCPKCPADTPQAVMKPDIVFFGESLPEEFHNQMAADKEQCELLIVIGSSLKVRPVALIPNSLPPNVPQILINKEPLKGLNFDVELLGDCDTIVTELCRQLGEGWNSLSESVEPLTEVSEDQLLTPPLSPTDNNMADKIHGDTVHKSDEHMANDDVMPESCVGSSGIVEISAEADQDKLVSSGTESGVSNLADSSCTCPDSQNEQIRDNVQRSPLSKKDKDDSLHSAIDICDSSNLSQPTSGNKNRTADEASGAENRKHITEKTEGAVSESNRNRADDSQVRPSENSHSQDVQSSEHEKENKADDSMELDQEAERKTRRTRTCSTSSVCYGDKDTCGCSADINELRKMWKPAVIKCSVAKRLGPNQYCFMPPSRYIFPEAEVYTVLEDTDSESSDSDKDDLDDLSDIDDNSDPLNTSEEQMDKNNSSLKPVSAEESENTVDNSNIVEDSGGGSLHNQSGTGRDGTVRQHGKIVDFKGDSGSNSVGNTSPDMDIQYPLVTTSNELSDSLIDNMDHFAKIDKNEDESEKNDIEKKQLNIDFEGT